MAKGKTATVFFCQNCGYESTKWLGQCPGCREWNTFVEETIDKTVLKNTGTGSRRERREASEPCVLSEIAIREENKTLTGIKELDRVLGGGIVQGSLTLVGGDPGIGKSTLLLQVCHNLSEAGHKVLYISGEESKVQIKMRADRLGTFSEHMLLLCETNLDIIGEVIRRSKPEVVIIDSIQTMYNENVSAAPGSVSQVRESTGILLQLAKGLGISIFIVGHVTKEGTVAGPRVLEHMVDTVLYFEGDRHAAYRILRSVKNRFGSTNEIGVFEMQQVGLVEVENPSEYMLNGRPEGASGSIVTCSIEGTRPILLVIYRCQRDDLCRVIVDAIGIVPSDTMLQIIAALPGERIVPIRIAIRVNIILERLINTFRNRCIAVVVDFLHKRLNVLNTIRAKHRGGRCATHLSQQAYNNQEQ